MTSIERGSQYGKWTVTDNYSGPIQGRVSCRCECGVERTVVAHTLTRGTSKSCGHNKGMKARNRVGERYGRWTVIGSLQGMKIPCQCDCGTERNVSISNLIGGSTTSCGCRKLQDLSDNPRGLTHGYSRHPLYHVWFQMVKRCTDPRHKNWSDYGGRGITVYPEWVTVAAFIEQIEAELGPRPDGLTLDRIDNDRGYEPGNVRWATRREQAVNRRSRWRNKEKE